MDGCSPLSTFTTILPPNAPSCSALEDSTYQAGRALVPATSYHSGGVNLVMCDGACKFVSDTIDVGTQLNEMPGASAGSAASGSSKYGVWGAAGTPAGNESKSL
jgi:prepilin-type processing-associated H-X9-DG protein